MKNFHGNANLLQDERHLCAHVVRGVHRRQLKITALHARTVSFVAAAVKVAPAVPGGLVFVNRDEAARKAGIPADAVEQEKLWFRAEEGGIAQA